MDEESEGLSVPSPPPINNPIIPVSSTRNTDQNNRTPVESEQGEQASKQPLPE